MKKALLLLFIFTNLNSLQSQVSEMDIPNTFFNIMERNGILEGIDYLYNTSEWLKNDTETKEQLKQKCKELLAEKRVGKYIGKQVITREIIGRTLSHISFMVNYDRQPYRFTFILYRPTRREKWRVHEFYFDSELIDELIERGKLFMLSEDRF